MKLEDLRRQLRKRPAPPPKPAQPPKRPFDRCACQAPASGLYRILSGRPVVCTGHTYNVGDLASLCARCYRVLKTEMKLKLIQRNRPASGT